MYLYSHQRASCKGLWSKQRVKFADLCCFCVWRGRVSGVVLLTHPSASSASLRMCVCECAYACGISSPLQVSGCLNDQLYETWPLNTRVWAAPSLSLPLSDHVWQDVPWANTPSRWIWTLTAILCLFKSLTVFYTAVYTNSPISHRSNAVILTILGRKERGGLSVTPSPISSVPLTRIVIFAAHFTCSHNPTAETVSGPPVGLDHRPVESGLRCFQSGCAALERETERENHHPPAN